MYVTSQRPLSDEELKKMPRFLLEELVHLPLQDYTYEVTKSGDFIREVKDWDKDHLSKKKKLIEQEILYLTLRYLENEQALEFPWRTEQNLAVILEGILKSKDDIVYLIKKGDEYVSRYTGIEDYTIDWSTAINALLFESRESAERMIRDNYIKDAVVVPYIFRRK